MKKILISIVAVAFVALMITNAYGQSLPCIPTPPNCCELCPGFTPGFWKHDLTVLIAHINGDPHAPSYNAFGWGPKAGQQLNDDMMWDYLNAINAATGLSLTPQTALDILKLPGWSTDRTNLANWFNWFAGYGWYVD